MKSEKWYEREYRLQQAEQRRTIYKRITIILSGVAIPLILLLFSLALFY